jgi:3-oxoacyl-[acyl-carrier-protein] synthase-3
MNSSIGISSISYYDAPQKFGVHQLAEHGRIESNPQQLRDFGFSTCLIADKSASDIAIEVGKTVMSAQGVAPEEVGLLICAPALSCSSVVPSENMLNHLDGPFNNLGLFKFSAARIQHALGLSHARVLGLSDLGCVSLINAVGLARDLLPGSGRRYALCINADVLPRNASREVLYSIISDAGCAVLVDTHADGCRIQASQQLTKGYYWDCEKTHNELLAAYFPTASRFIQRFLRENGLGLSDIARILPNNVSKRSWEILVSLLGIDIEKIYTPNISRCGHSIAADNFINLKDALAAGEVESGQKVLLFGFGLGAHWSCMLVNI